MAVLPKDFEPYQLLSRFRVIVAYSHPLVISLLVTSPYKSICSRLTLSTNRSTQNGTLSTWDFITNTNLPDTIATLSAQNVACSKTILVVI